MSEFEADGGDGDATAPLTFKLADSPEWQATLSPALLKVASMLERRGFEVRVAGGAVRDLLSGGAPADVDLATTATPDQMHALFDEQAVRTLHTRGEQHGTVTCRLDDVNFELTTLRVDRVCDGRRAAVDFTRDWRRDAQRRDLTVNSLFLGLDGTVYDYFGGAADLRARRVAFVGSATERIQEDYLRILRYFRFFGRLAESPDAHDPHTLAAIAANAGGLADVAGERLWMELKKLLVGRFGAHLVRTLLDCGVARHLGLPDTADVDNYERVAQLTEGASPQPMTRLVALLKDADEVAALDRRLKVSAVERRIAVFIVERRHLSEPHLLADPRKHFQDLLLDQGGDKTPHGRPLVCELLKYLGQSDLLAHIESWEPPRFPLNGLQLAIAGVPKGPQMQRALDLLFDEWKQSNYESTADQLLARVPQLDLGDAPPPKRLARSRLKSK